MKTGFFWLFVSIALLGCGGHGTRDFSALGPVTAITVTESNASDLVPKITDARTISQIAAFVDAHRTGWAVPWYGVPVPVVIVQFYSGAEFKGSFGVGKDFLETQRDGSFFSQNAIPDDVHDFLALLPPKDSQSERVETSAVPEGPQACNWPSGIVPDGPPSPQRIIIGASTAASSLKHEVRPTYPADAWRKRVEGTVSFCAIIAKDGTIQRLQYVSGPESLMRAALDAVKESRYEPTLVNNEPVEVETRIHVKFSLEDSARKANQAPKHE